MNVPGSLADSLVRDGFRQVGIERGIDPEWALAADANPVTIFVSRHEIAQFVVRLWAAARGRPAIRARSLLEALAERDENRPAAVPRSHPQEPGRGVCGRFRQGRLGALFRQPAQIADELHRSQAIAKRLTLEHNELVREAGQAATAGRRQRAHAKASRKGEDGQGARLR